MLTGYRCFGFTDFGFWLPLGFWLIYGLCLCLWFRGELKESLKDCLILIVLSVLVTFDITLPGVYGLENIGFITLLPLWFATIRSEASYMRVGLVTYLSALAVDFIGTPIMSLQHTGWLPFLVLTQPYHDNLAHYQTIGGAGLLDGLLIAPFVSMLIVFMARTDWRTVVSF